MKNAYKISLFIFWSLLISVGCQDHENAIRISTDFESGSIGEVRRINERELELFLADDNFNEDLPDHWRTWWYVRMDNVQTDDEVIIHLKNRGWPYYFLPVYSYDNEVWYRFAENEISQSDEYELRMEKKFKNPTVWIARFYPYTYSDLISYIATVSDNPHIRIETPAATQEGNPIYFLTLTNAEVPDSDKKRIWIHGRTHPAETGPSFLIEGMIDFLLSGLPEAESILSQFIFNIVPMQNIDGVMAGNYRTTPASENIEVMWFPDPEDPMQLTDDAPKEVKALHRIIINLIDKGPAFSVALNLHASNSEPDVRPFFFPHFGPEALGYTMTEASLWNKQLRFINAVGRYYGKNMLEPVPDEGGRSFASKTYPESWWWNNFQDEVMAITMETTYGRAGYGPDWITPEDLRSLGDAMAPALRDYAMEIESPMESIVRTNRLHRNGILNYPERYPPEDPDEMKE